MQTANTSRIFAKRFHPPLGVCLRQGDQTKRRRLLGRWSSSESLDANHCSPGMKLRPCAPPAWVKVLCFKSSKRERPQMVARFCTLNASIYANHMRKWQGVLLRQALGKSSLIQPRQCWNNPFSHSASSAQTACTSPWAVSEKTAKALSSSIHLTSNSAGNFSQSGCFWHTSFLACHRLDPKKDHAWDPSRPTRCSKL